MKRNKAKTAALTIVIAINIFAIIASRTLYAKTMFGEGLQAYITLLILTSAAFLFMTEIIPISVTAMCIPILLTLSGVVPARDAFNGFSNDNVILFGGMFVVGGTLFVTGVAHKIGCFVLDLAKDSRNRVTLGVIIVTALLSSVLSNTGTVAVLMPVCIAIADAAGWERKKLLLPLAFMASTGGMITLVGTPPNITANAILLEFGLREFRFFEYAYIGIPISVISGAYLMIHQIAGKKEAGTAGSVLTTVFKEEQEVYASELKQGIATIVLIILVIIMASGIIPLHVAAVAGALVCLITGAITTKQAIEAIDWTTIFLFGGTLSLATALSTSGAGAMIANSFIHLIGADAGPNIIVAGMFFITAMLTQFMSNTVTCALIAPIGLQIANGLGISPHPLLMTIAIAASAAFTTPIGTPPNTLVTGPGDMTFSDFLKIGTPLLLISFLLTYMIVPLVWSIH